MKGCCWLAVWDRVLGLYGTALSCVVTLPVSPSWPGLSEVIERSKLILSAHQTHFMSLLHEAVGKWLRSTLSLLFNLETYWKELFSSKIFHPNTHLFHYSHWIIKKLICKYVCMYIYVCVCMCADMQNNIANAILNFPNKLHFPFIASSFFIYSISLPIINLTMITKVSL